MSFPLRSSFEVLVQHHLLTPRFFAAESGSSYHEDAEITLERERCGPS